ncbi:MAG: peroxiredoxin [Pseudomonadota bacterium]
MLTIGHKVPDFAAITNCGELSFYDWLGDDWCVLFSHPKDFTPVCTTELGEAARLAGRFEERGAKLLGLSVDAADRHHEWCKDIREVSGFSPAFPMIADTDLEVSKMFGMLPADATGNSDERSAMDNATVRTVFMIGPDKTVKMAMAYPMSTGRSFNELLRVLDSLQLTAQQKVATPAEWQPGDSVFILPAINDDDAAEMFGSWSSPLPYMRIVPQPGSAAA